MNTVYELIPLVAMAVNLLVGAYVISRDPEGLANRLFLGVTIALSLWGFGEFIMRTASTSGQALWGARIGSLGWCLVAPIFLHLAFVLAEAGPSAWRRGALLASYSLGAVFTIVTWTSDLVFRDFVTYSFGGYREVAGVLRLSSKVFVATVFLTGVAVLAYHFHAAASREKRVRLGWTLAASLVPIVTGLVTDVLLPEFGVHPPVSSQVATPVMALMTAYAVTRYDMMRTVMASLGPSTIDKIAEAVFVTDADGIIESANPAAALLSGRGAADLVNTGIKDLLTETPWSSTPGIAPTGQERIWCLFNGAGRERIPVAVSTESVRKRSGMTVGSVVVVQDMRETLELVQAEHEASAAVVAAEVERGRAETLKRSHDELLRVSSFLESVIDNITEPLSIKDLEGRYVFVNRSICEASRRSREDIIGKTSEEAGLIPPDVIQVIRRAEDEVIASGSSAVAELGGIPDVDGELNFWNLRLAPLKDRNGHVEYIVSIASDVTEEKRLDKARLDFIRVAAHELRTPLTSLKLGFEMLARETRGALDEEQQRSLDVLSLSIERLSSLARNLLDLASMDAGLLALNQQPVEMGPLVNEAAALFSGTLASKGLYCEVAVDEGLRPAYADASRLAQVLYNLMSNAVKYTETGGIVISARDPGDDFLEICVADTGVGISPAERDSIFTSFVKVRDASGSREGTGLGLSITKAIVEAHGGSLRVESEPGQGSSFYFTVRAVEPGRR